VKAELFLVPLITNKGDPFNFKGEDGKYPDVSDKIIEGYKFTNKLINCIILTKNY
jgi:hypothetical protein